MDHKCSMCFVCVCVPCLSICFSLSNLKPFWFGARGDCSQMLIRGRLQTAISLISLGEATWGSVRAKAEQRKHVWSYQPVAHSEKREAFSLFHLWKEEFKAECPPLPSTLQHCTMEKLDCLSRQEVSFPSPQPLWFTRISSWKEISVWVQ